MDIEMLQTNVKFYKLIMGIFSSVRNKHINKLGKERMI